jgi:hypothetical protein
MSTDPADAIATALRAILDQPHATSPASIAALTGIPPREIARLIRDDRATVDAACAEHQVRITAYDRRADGPARITFVRQ